MREIGLEELKAIQLDILKDIHSFCVSHDIKYSLAFGSLLGAIRHGGFIPWDDDIDIMMRRDEYERFIRAYGNDKYRIADLSTNAGYGLPFAKVEDVRTVMEESVEGASAYGVYIDVFPVDFIPDDVSKRKRYYRKKSLINALYNLKVIKVNKERSILKNSVLIISHVLLFFLSKQYLAHMMSVYASRYQGQKTGYVGIVAPADSRIEEIVPSDFFKEYVELPFENIKVMSIKEYANYLKAFYGDYMKLPPIDKRISHHVFNAYWK